MNALFLTQGKTLSLFYDLANILEEPLKLGKIGFYVQKHAYFRYFSRQNPEINLEKYTFLKEWEIWEKAKEIKPDILLLRRYEEIFKIPSFWDAFICDRRLIWGKWFTLKQDYQSRYGYGQMLSFLQQSLLEAERLFNALQPQFVVSFICTTLGEYLSYLFAKSRKIPFLNLRPTRIKNYMTYGESVYEPSLAIKSAFEEYMLKGASDSWAVCARQHVNFVRTEHARYEGALLPSRKPSFQTRKKVPIPFYKKLIGILKSEYEYRAIGPKFDHTVPGGVMPYFYQTIKLPCQAFLTNLKLKKKYVTAGELKDLDYAFFPLHTEPEVTLLVYGRHFLNQIEAARNIAYNLPAGMLLLIKEHPHSIGKRPLGYYKKLFQIPNVRLADPALESRAVIFHSRLAITIAGSIGLEAALLGRPVVTLGCTPYEIFPQNMVKRVTDFNCLGKAIQEILLNYKFEEKAAVSYVAAVMKESVAINFYTGLLAKSGFSLPQTVTGAQQSDIRKLGQYTIDKLRQLTISNQGGRVRNEG